MGVPEDGPDGTKTFTAYSFDAVKAVFTDNITFSTRIYEDMVRPLQGPTILEMQEPEHATYRRLHEFAFARSSMKRWDTELVGPLVDRTIAKFRDNKRADVVNAVFMPIPVGSSPPCSACPNPMSASFTGWPSTCWAFVPTWKRR